jgi:hypothetical protein
MQLSVNCATNQKNLKIENIKIKRNENANHINCLRTNTQWIVIGDTGGRMRCGVVENMFAFEPTSIIYFSKFNRNS